VPPTPAESQTVTVAAFDAEPPAPVASRLKVVVLDTDTTLVPEVAGLSAPTPLSTLSDVASVTVQLKVLEPPAAGKVVGWAMKDWICGLEGVLPPLEPQERENNKITNREERRISGPLERIPSEAI